jgi:phosphopantetheine--protein transferase-like protein
MTPMSETMDGPVGLGVDVVPFDRMSRSLARDTAFAAAYFTSAERRHCDAAARPEAAYATLLAVKEAFLKAVGVGILAGIGLREVEVEPTSRGSARLHLGPAAEAAMRRRGGVRALVATALDDRRGWALVVLCA